MASVEAQFAVAKVSKYATSESGDTIEMIERPAGGISFVLVDGQRSGKPAKNISNVVARKAVSLLAEGVRDGAAARAASDYLYSYRGGKVSATLNILSVDLASKTLVITRNNPCPVILVEKSEPHYLDAPTEAVGTRRDTRPEITQIPLTEGLAAFAFTDGLLYAGERKKQSMDLLAEAENLIEEQPTDPTYWANSILAKALELEDQRPGDDISLLIACVVPGNDDKSRTLSVRVPL